MMARLISQALAGAYGCAAVLDLVGVISLPWWFWFAPVWLPVGIFAAAVGAVQACMSWDEHMSWAPALPVFWFDNPRWVGLKISAALSLLAMLETIAATLIAAGQ